MVQKDIKGKVDLPLTSVARFLSSPFQRLLLSGFYESFQRYSQNLRTAMLIFIFFTQMIA